MAAFFSAWGLCFADDSVSVKAPGDRHGSAELTGQHSEWWTGKDRSRHARSGVLSRVTFALAVHSQEPSTSSIKLIRSYNGLVIWTIKLIKFLYRLPYRKPGLLQRMNFGMDCWMITFRVVLRGLQVVLVLVHLRTIRSNISFCFASFRRCLEQSTVNTKSTSDPKAFFTLCGIVHTAQDFCSRRVIVT